VSSYLKITKGVMGFNEYSALKFEDSSGASGSAMTCTWKCGSTGNCTLSCKRN